MAYKHDDLLYEAMKSQTKRFLIASLIPGSSNSGTSIHLVLKAGVGEIQKYTETKEKFSCTQPFNERVENNLNFILLRCCCFNNFLLYFLVLKAIIRAGKKR
jgi:hypothetical protein